MRFYDLKNLSDEEAIKLITNCPKIKMEDALKNPVSLLKKIVVFLGNYDRFDTKRLCARTFEYIPEKDRWKVCDWTIYDLWGSSFDHYFLKNEIKTQFSEFCKTTGFVMEV